MTSIAFTAAFTQNIYSYINLSSPSLQISPGEPEHTRQSYWVKVTSEARTDSTIGLYSLAGRD